MLVSRMSDVFVVINRVCTMLQGMGEATEAAGDGGAAAGDGGAGDARAVRSGGGAAWPAAQHTPARRRVRTGRAPAAARALPGP